MEVSQVAGSLSDALARCVGSIVTEFFFLVPYFALARKCEAILKELLVNPVILLLNSRLKTRLFAPQLQRISGCHVMPRFLSRVVKMPKDSIPELLPERGTHDVFGQAQL